jgi:hypothetical protein
MIQRIQSVWLFLATLVLILMIFLPLATKVTDGSEWIIYTSGSHQNMPAQDAKVLKAEVFVPLLAANIVLILLCFVNIFNFKRRSAQKKVAIFTILAIIGFAFWCSLYAKELPGGIEGASFGVGAYLPAVAILFIVLAIFGINKDERLIRSAERLR